GILVDVGEERGADGLAGEVVAAVELRDALEVREQVRLVQIAIELEVAELPRLGRVVDDEAAIDAVSVARAADDRVAALVSRVLPDPVRGGQTASLKRE